MPGTRWEPAPTPAIAGLPLLVADWSTLGTVCGVLGVMGAGVVWIWMRRRSAVNATGPELDAERLPRILEHAEAMLWEASVEVSGDDWQWSFRMPPSALAKRLFPGYELAPRSMLWRQHHVPQRAEMDARAREAVRRGDAGYEQEFEVVRESGSCWMRETVSIKPLAPGRWWLAGVVTDVSKQKALEAARRESEQLLTDILNSADCLLWRTRVERQDGEWKWLGFEIPNSRLSPRLFGDRSISATGYLWNRLQVPQLAEMEERCRVALETGAPGYEQEFNATNHRGESFWLHEQVSIQRLDDDARFLVGVITDVTARRQAELAVRASERRYRALFTHVPVAIVQADFTEVGRWLEELRSKGVTDFEAYLEENPKEIVRAAMKARLVQSNDSARHLFGVTDHRELRWRRQVFSTPSGIQTIARTYGQLWRGRNTLVAEVDVQDAHGRLHQTALRWWVARDEHGLDLQFAVMVFVDVTDLKRVEANLAEEKERLAVTLRAMNEAVVTTTVDGAIRFLNAAALQLSGWPETEAIGRPVTEVFPLHDQKTGDPVTLPVEGAQTGSRAPMLPVVALESRGGRERLVQGRFAPVKSADGAVVGTVHVFRDVTEQTRLETEMVRATRLEAIGVLAGGIAHDFNNLLTAILGNVSLAAMGVSPDSELGRLLHEVESAAERAGNLTAQLLTFAKGGEPVRQTTQLEGFIRETAVFSLPGSNVRCQFVIAPDLWVAEVDKAQIGRVIQNLVLNASQAMSEGGEVRIEAVNETVAVARPGLEVGDYVRLSIIDSGVGIEPENLGRIFDPFFSTKEIGTGLGLSAVYSIVKKHAGHIDVTSSPGRGSTFTVWLPATPVSAVESNPSVETAARLFPGVKVLFMDDEEVIRRLAELLFSRLEVEFVPAADGAEAVERFQSAREAGQPFDVVITDLTVPGGMGGLEALKRLLVIDPTVKVVVSSGYSNDPILANHRRHGFADVVAKPYVLEDIRAVLGRVLGPAEGSG